MQLATIKGMLGRGSCVLMSAAAMLLAAAVSAPSAGATLPGSQLAGARCVGTPEAPGILAGRYNGTVFIEGVCKVNSGPVTVRGNLVVREGASLLAAYGQNQQTGSGSSNLRVFGNVRVLAGATLILGCEPESFPCLDNPALSARGTIYGNLGAREPLGVVVHNSRILGRLREVRGGGGKKCEPAGPFLELGEHGVPVYSAFENTTVGGSVEVIGLESCWLGFARLRVGNMRVNENQLADPNAIEILSNRVQGNLACHGNSQVWNSAHLTEELFPRAPAPNTVFGKRSGQCVHASPETKEALEKGEFGSGPF